MRAIGGLALVITVLVSVSGCNCHPAGTGSGGGGGHSGGGSGGSGGGGAGTGGGGASGGGLIVTPPDQTVDVTTGGPAGTAQYLAHLASLDVTSGASWSIDDASFGTIAGGLFTSSGASGGVTTVRAAYQGLSGAALLHVRLHATGGSCPGCPSFPPLGGSTPSCGAAAAPTLIYPPDGVLLPPNMNVIEVQFMPGQGVSAYEIDFENAITDVRLVTPCNAITDTRGAATGGCGFSLDPTQWKWVANTNRAGDPVKVSVRATTNGSCASESAQRNLTFAEQDLNGGLYYWQSLVVGGVAGKTGGIYRYDFGNPGATSVPFLTPATGSCVGCHFLSRDGTRMTYGTDDADSDDEYGDLSGHLLDVGAKTVIATSGGTGTSRPLPPGFQTFNHDATSVMASTGQAANTFFQVWNAQTGGTPTGQMPTGMRGTQPDWSADDSKVIFVVPSKFANAFSPTPYARADDDHFKGGSLFVNTYDSSSKAFGTPTALVTASGNQNNYYPSYSPDSPPTFIVFNRVDDPAVTSDLAGDAFNNPYAKIWVLSTASGAAPIEAKNANGDPKMTNSWPRWSPFVQSYKGSRLLWVTFSSTRDYGLHVRNSVKVDNGSGTLVDQVNCYPPDSPQNPTGSHTQPLPANCNQPQIWMAAINLSTAELAGAGDPSFPAFWLPFQDVNSHNHIAQWTQTVVNPGGGGACDGGQPMCLASNAACGPSICGTCCNGDICQSGVCSPGIN